eukprot:TRINITY_DN2835_c0_g1_i2.p1 TRINITY_DN2835_c0_g1~~TRINITY_DN2835_c0_g1_i2.p1  ORF type:complete len:232 (+),score=12.19 TRINITY_DN2835_c0_g1_i2:87-782(+)
MPSRKYTPRVLLLLATLYLLFGQIRTGCVDERCAGLAGDAFDVCQMKCQILCSAVFDYTTAKLDPKLNDTRKTYCQSSKLIGADRVGLRVEMSTSWNSRQENYHLGSVGLPIQNNDGSTYKAGAWCALYNDSLQWIDFRSETIREWVAIDLQGRQDADVWVTGFKVSSSLDGVIWKKLENDRIFPGSKDRNTPVRITFSEPVYGNILRINPVSVNPGGHPCLRIEAYFLRR